MRLPFLRRRREPTQARHRATGPSTYQQIRALTTADTRHLPVVDGPVVLTAEQAHARAATYRSAGLPTPYERDRLAELEGDTHVMRGAEIRDALDGGEPHELVRPYIQARPA